MLRENLFGEEESSNCEIERSKESGLKDNRSDYWYQIRVSQSKKEGSEVIKKDYEGEEREIKKIIDGYNKGVGEEKVSVNDVEVLGDCGFSVFVEYMKRRCVYEIMEK